jgi:hypothetical protein
LKPNADVFKSYGTLYPLVAFVACDVEVWARRPGVSSMAAIDVKVIQELLVHIDALNRAIQTAGDVGRIRLREIKVDEVRKAVLGNAAGLDAVAWSQFPEDEQNELHHRLTEVG